MRLMHLALASTVLAGCKADGALFRGRAEAATEDLANGTASPSQFPARRIWSLHYNDDATAPWDISPDGRDLLITNYDTEGELALLDIERRGEKRTLTSLLSDEASQYIDHGSFSPDGSRIAFRSNTPDGEWELRVLELAGGSESVVLRTGEPVSNLEVRDWSPDGSALLVATVGADQRRSLAVVRVADGTLRNLRSFDWLVPDRAAFSNDGRFIAYQRRFDETAPDRDLYLIPTDGGDEVRLTEGGGRKILLGWSTDDSALLYATRQPDDAADVWRLPIANGRRAGSAVRVQSDVWGFTPEALVGEDVYYTVSSASTMSQVLELGVDPLRLNATSDARVVSTTGSRDGAGMGAYSPDGNRVAYIVFAIPNVIVVETMATGETIEFVPPMRGIAALTWTADGRALILTGGGTSGRGAFRFDIASRDFTQIATFDASDGNPYSLSADGSSVYLVRGSENARTIAVRDLTSGSERILFSTAAGIGTMSPQGDRMAFFTDGENGRRALVVASAGGGEPRVLYRDPADAEETGRISQFRSIAWTPDGQHVLFVKIAPGVTQRTATQTAHGRQTIMAVPAQGGDARVIFSIDDMPQLLRDTHLSGDGRRLLFTGGGDPDKRVELWVLEGVAGPSVGGNR